MTKCRHGTGMESFATGRTLTPGFTIKSSPPGDTGHYRGGGAPGQRGSPPPAKLARSLVCHPLACRPLFPADFNLGRGHELCLLSRWAVPAHPQHVCCGTGDGTPWSLPPRPRSRGDSDSFSEASLPSFGAGASALATARATPCSPSALCF